MKTLLSILLSVTILFSSLGSTILFIHYSINKSYYAKVLCENRSKPMMHCNGKCKLGKELKELERKAEAPFSPLKEKQETFQFFEEQQILLLCTSAFQPKHTARYLVKNTQEVYFSVFHPPAV